MQRLEPGKGAYEWNREGLRPFSAVTKLTDGYIELHAFYESPKLRFECDHESEPNHRIAEREDIHSIDDRCCLVVNLPRGALELEVEFITSIARNVILDFRVQSMLFIILVFRFL